MTLIRISAPTMLKTAFAAFALVLALGMAPAAYAACTTPTGAAGEMIYNDDNNIMQFCDGTNWIGMAGGGGGGGAGLVDGDMGDVTVGGSGTTLTVDNGAVSYAKLQNTSAASVLLGRGSAGGAGAVQELTLGSGLVLTGTVLSASGVAPTADSLDFTDFKDAMTLDASTDIAVMGSYVLSITNTGTGNSFVVNDQASDTTPFVIDAAGQVGIGIATPAAPLDVSGAVTANLVNFKSVSGAAAPTGSGGSGGGWQTMTTVQRDALTPTDGLMIYNTTAHQPQYYNGTAWVSMSGAFASSGSGTSAALAGTSCKTIYDGGFSTGDGTYWIDPDGAGGNAAFQATCDMTSTGGGWTLVFNSTGTSNSYPDTPYTTTITSFDISGRFTNITTAPKMAKINGLSYTGNIYSTNSSSNNWTNGTQALGRAGSYYKFAATITYAAGFPLIGTANAGSWCNSADLIAKGNFTTAVGELVGTFAEQAGCNSGANYKTGGFTLQVYTQ